MRRGIFFLFRDGGNATDKSINLTLRRFVSNKRVFTEFEEEIYDARNKRLYLENNKESENLPKVAGDNTSINSFNSLGVNLEVNINESEYRHNNQYKDEIVFYTNRLKELREIMAETIDPCDKVKTLDELDRQEDAFCNFIHSNIKLNSESEKAIIEKLMEAGQDEFLYNWKGYRYLWAHYPDHRWPMPVEELKNDTSKTPKVEEENSPSDNNNNKSSQDNDDDDKGDSATSGDLSSGNNNTSGGENPPLGNSTSSSRNYSLDSINSNFFSYIKPEINGSDFLSLIVFHLLNALSLIMDILTQIYLS